MYAQWVLTSSYVVQTLAMLLFYQFLSFFYYVLTFLSFFKTFFNIFLSCLFHLKHVFAFFLHFKSLIEILNLFGKYSIPKPLRCRVLIFFGECLTSLIGHVLNPSKTG